MFRLFCIQAVLYYYQSGGRLRRPIEVPEDVFLEELEFYQISEETIRQYKEKEGFLMEKKKALPAKSWQRRVWLFCEEPESSKPAKVRPSQRKKESKTWISIAHNRQPKP